MSSGDSELTGVPARRRQHRTTAVSCPHGPTLPPGRMRRRPPHMELQPPQPPLSPPPPPPMSPNLLLLWFPAAPIRADVMPLHLGLVGCSDSRRRVRRADPVSGRLGAARTGDLPVWNPRYLVSSDRRVQQRFISLSIMVSG